MRATARLNRTSTLTARRKGGDSALALATDEARRKANGIHYTPPLLAAYLAEQVMKGLIAGRTPIGEIAVLDPACGEGELLKAIVDAAPHTWRARLRLTGFDMDENALARTRSLLEDSGVASVDLHAEDFLSHVDRIEGASQMDFLRPPVRREQILFDAAISNPPYVRTQILGSVSARELAARFDLTGRVDLYHAFVKAMTLLLREGGILGLLTSNRFLTVQSGYSMRDWLASQFRLRRLVDLGDTKLFDAAVLPAIVVAERTSSAGPQNCEFIRVYESPQSGAPDGREELSILDVLDGTYSGLVQAGGTRFRVETGKLRIAADSRTPWAMHSRGVDAWLAQVKANSACVFADVARICVGIKTTADSVFVRDDWESLPSSQRPEPELLRPLVTHHLATRWHLPENTVRARQVLYPYVRNATERQPVDLADYPCARAYLLKHRERLESRSYVTGAGRRWYEVWVPHRPSDWTHPKLAFPDISESNKFFLADPGWIVNGDCYWTKLLPGKDWSWLMLMLAVANSSFALTFYDTVFHNKLYSGRRRFMSQYVSRFPLPKMTRAQGVVDFMPSVLAAARRENSLELARLERDLDALVWEAFGLSKEVAR
ncbi:MAG TPA: methyltransferase domain-containing protein [Candidatus Paceibacterota bacterium]|nr:methyltransferase domain-containing protein [Candidatus Paceibacterota bacterium]HRZ54059.1 methyltransferase domain-containing protein [Candidatus Paceibacterota bacterium]